MNNTKEKSKQMFGWLEKSTSGLKSKLLRVLFPNEHGGTNYYHYEHRVIMFVNKIKWWCKLSKVFLKFWKIPFAINDLETALDYSFKHIDDQYDQIKDKENTIEGLIEQLVEERWDNTMTEGMNEDEHYKKCYRDIFMAYSDYDENKYGLALSQLGGIQIPDKYLTERESDHRWEIGYEENRIAMCGTYDTYYDDARYIAEGLKRRGFLNDYKS